MAILLPFFRPIYLWIYLIINYFNYEYLIIKNNNLLNKLKVLD